jgi:hypothetical protein
MKHTRMDYQIEKVSSTISIMLQQKKIAHGCKQSWQIGDNNNQAYKEKINDEQRIQLIGI